MSEEKKNNGSILCLGAGLVTAPGVRYLCEAGFSVTVASRTVAKAEKIVDGLKSGSALQLDVTDEKQSEQLEKLIQDHDLVISLLPWTQHVPVCKLALKHKTHFASTSYISDEMEALDSDFKAAGVVCFNECGVDPGLDHMSALKIIDAVHAEGGKIDTFLSYCGGLPCPDDNNNPFGYKFSWSPKGVLLAAKRVAKYLENGESITLDGNPGSMIYDRYLEDKSVPNVGPKLEGEWPATFECHPNGDSLKFVKIYRIPEVKTLIRGSYRSAGWCPTMKAVTLLGLLKDDDVTSMKGKPYLSFLNNTLGQPEETTAADLKKFIANKLSLKVDDAIFERLEWLGLFSTEKKVVKDTCIDALSDLFFDNPSFWYAEGERDMIAMHHTFHVERKDGTKEKITSTMVDYGIKNGDTSMSRTVSLPLAIMVKRILNGEAKELAGVCRPTAAASYNPVLEEMEKSFGVTFVDKTTPL